METKLKRVAGHTLELIEIKEWTKEVHLESGMSRATYVVHGEKVESLFCDDDQLEDLIIGWEDGRQYIDFGCGTYLAANATCKTVEISGGSIQSRHLCK